MQRYVTKYTLKKYKTYLNLKSTGGNRWFNIGIQPVKCITEEVIVSEMTFNCHRGFCLITKQHPLRENAAPMDIQCIASKIHLDTEEGRMVAS